MEDLKVKINAVGIAHPHFSYLGGYDRAEIFADLAMGKSFIATFEEKGAPIFSVVLDRTSDGFHIREAGGNFPRRVKVLWIFLLGMLDKIKGTSLTIAYTSRLACIGIAKKYGFRENQYGDYELRFSHGR